MKSGKIYSATLAALAFLFAAHAAQSQDLAQDLALGEKVYKKCKACHAVGEGAKNKIGPQQNDLFGRVAGTAEGYKYSKAMIAAGEAGLIWTDASLTEYLKKPKAFVPKTKMSFSGLKKDEQIAAVIAYLKTFDTDGMPEEDASSYQPGS